MMSASLTIKTTAAARAMVFAAAGRTWSSLAWASCHTLVMSSLVASPGER